MPPGSLALSGEVSHNTEVKRLFIEALAHIGVDLDYTYWDRLRPPSCHADIAPKLGVHRDTWAPYILRQINWWAPYTRSLRIVV